MRKATYRRAEGHEHARKSAAAAVRRVYHTYKRRPYRRHGKKPLALVFPLSVKRLKELALRAAVAATLLLLAFGAWRLLNPALKIRASAETVAAFRVPYRSLGMLKAFAAKHGVPFPELFTLFCAENGFFPEKAVAYDLSVLEDRYVVNFDLLKRKYDAASIAPYADMYRNIFMEIECFPITADFDEEDELSYMFGDNWGAARNFEGDRQHKGADIFDRENVRGRIPVVSMTSGTVQEAGWDGTLGYYTGIVTVNGTYYLYAHLDSLAETIVAGMPVSAGQPIGQMGDSGTRDAQVHAHIGIAPKAGFSKQTFWINPYPLLRYIENTPLI